MPDDRGHAARMPSPGVGRRAVDRPRSGATLPAGAINPAPVAGVAGRIRQNSPRNHSESPRRRRGPGRPPLEAGPSQRWQRVARVALFLRLQHRESWRYIARQTGFPVRTLRRWVRRYQDLGLDSETLEFPPRNRV